MRLLVFAVALTAAPSIEELARDAMANKKRFDRDLTEYTYDFHSIFIDYDSKGRESKRTEVTGETYQSSRRNVNVNLTWNGKAIDTKKVEKARLEVAKALQADFDRRLKAPKGDWDQGPEYGVNFGSLLMDIFEVLRNCPLRNLRREDGQYVFDFLPAGTPVKGLAHLSSIRGTFWIDEKTRMVTKWLAFAPGGTLLFEQVWAPAPDGSLLGKRLHVNLNAAPELFKNRRSEWIAVFSNHKRFNVGVEQKIESPVQ